MQPEPTLSTGALFFLFIIGGIADLLKIAFEAFFGIGLVLNPFLVTPLTALIYGIVFAHFGLPMFRGKFAKGSWFNLIVSLTPILDFLPDWTAYNIYLAITNSLKRSSQRATESDVDTGGGFAEQAA